MTGPRRRAWGGKGVVLNSDDRRSVLNSDDRRSEYAVRALQPFSVSAFFPISAVFHSAPPTIGAFPENTAEIGRNAEREGAEGKAPQSHGRRPA